MSETGSALTAAVDERPKTHLLELAEKLLGDKSLTPALEKALQHLHDDEYDRLPKDEKRAFWGEVVRKELARQGVAKGQLAMSGLNATETSTSVALAGLEKQDPKCAAMVKASLARLRSVAIECASCESLVLPRFKAEDDRCRVCGELLPVAESFGTVEDAAHVAALMDEQVEALADNVTLAADTSPPAWEVVAPKPDLTKLLKLAADNLDWDDVLAGRRKADEDARRKVEDAARQKAEAEAAARRKVEEEEARKKAEAEAVARRKREEDAARQKAADEAKKRVEAEAAAKVAAAETARKKVEEEVRAKKQAEDDKRRKQEETVAAQKRAEEDLRRKQEEEVAAQKRAEEELLEKQKRAEQELRDKQEDEERRRKQEQERPAIGCLSGMNAGQNIRINDLDPKLKPSGARPLVVITGGKAKILVPSSTKAFINEKKVAGGIFDLAPGDIVRGIFEDDDLSVIEETGELQGVNADPVHFKRDDEEHGGPWNYWNEPIRIGSGGGCEVSVNDDHVDEQHALVATRFGRVVVEDTSKQSDGVWVNGERVKALIAKPGVKFKLGSKGPTLAVAEGQAEIKDAPVATAPMKPARYVRTVLHVQTTRGEHQKVFLFARREVRFGKLFSRDELKVENDLVLAPADDFQTVGDKQGSFSLTREGVTVRRDDRKIDLNVNDEELNPGQSVLLKREFTIEIGTGVNLQGQVYRAPATSKRPDGPAQLGIEGGHPNECVKMVREGDDSGHTYVFLVRQIRLGSGQTDSIQLPGIGVAPGHAVIQLSRGVMQIIAPRDKNKVKLDGQTLKTGVPYPLKLGAKILLGECLLRFEVVQESDFKIQTAAVS